MKLKPLKIEKDGWETNSALVHQVVVKELASRRQGNAKVKSRNEVTGSTRKIYRQKGTGNARHGDIKAPLFVGGGRAFGPKPKDWSYVLPRKIRQGGLKSAVALRIEESKLWLLEIDLKEPKTKKAAEAFGSVKIGNALVVVTAGDQVAERSIRNLPRFEVRRWDDVSVVDVMKHEHLVLTSEALKNLEGRANCPRVS